LERFIYVLNYLACIIVGGAIGFFLGTVAALIALDSLPSAWLEVIEAHKLVNAIVLSVSVCVSGYSISRFIAAYDRYHWLIELKRQHRMVYFSIRHWYAEPTSTFGDILWASSYIFAETFLPSLVGILAAVLSFVVITSQFQDTPWLYHIPVYVLSWFVGWHAYGLAFRFVIEFFNPKRHQREISEAQGTLEIFRIRQEEERRYQEQQGGKERLQQPTREPDWTLQQEDRRPYVKRRSRKRQ